MNQYNKTYLFSLLLVLFCTIKAAHLENITVKKKENRYSLTSGEKTARLYINWYGLNKFSVSSWPGGIENDIPGRNLKILAIAFLTFNKKKLLHIDYKYKENDPDINIFLDILLKSYREEK